MSELLPSAGGFLLAAVQYGRLGWRVLPVKPRQKQPPLIKAWQDKATTDEAVLASWGEQWPYANLAVATGRGSGVVVIDIDGEPGELAIDTLQSILGPLPHTCKQTTGRGRQLFFAYPTNTAIRNTTAFAGHKGIDVREEGRYAIIPASIHPNSKMYTSEASSDPLNGGILVTLPQPWVAAQDGSTRPSQTHGRREDAR